VHVAWEDATPDLGGSGSDWDIIYKNWTAAAGWSSLQVVSTESTGDSRNPTMVVDHEGAVHVAWEDFTPDLGGSGVDRDIIYKNWTAAAGWSPLQVVSIESTEVSSSPNLIVGPDGAVHVAWHDATNHESIGTDWDIFYKNWTAAVGWSSLQVVSAESTGNSYNPNLAVGQDGAVHVAWHDYTDYEDAGTDADIFYKNWTAAVGWSPLQVVSAESTGISEWPSLTVNPDGDVHVAWQDYTDYGGAGTDADIFYKNWTTATGWSPPQVVSEVSTGLSQSASLAVGPDGAKHIAWHDSMDYLEAGADSDIFYRVSTDLPAQVTGLEATPDATDITLTWDVPADGGSPITHYNVYRAASETGTYSLLGTNTTVTGYLDGTAGAGVTYWYKVTAVNLQGEGLQSAPVSGAVWDIPGQVAEFSAVPGVAGIALAWTAPADGGSPITHYNVYQAASETGTYSLLGTNTTDSGYLDGSAEPGVTYWYKVTAVNVLGEGPLSAPVNGTAWDTPAQATGLTATPSGAGVTLTWTAPADGGTPITHYNVYRATSETGSYSLLGTNTTAIGYLDETAEAGVTYWYKVAAVNVLGEGPNSAPAMGTMPPAGDDDDDTPGDDDGAFFQELFDQIMNSPYFLPGVGVAAAVMILLGVLKGRKKGAKRN
jgi:fibronectin type 3 domain-containing protein